MRVISDTEKIVLGLWLPKNQPVEVTESQGKFLVDTEGFEVYNPSQTSNRNSHKNKNIKDGGKK